jgi:hypothetical protein
MSWINKFFSDGEDQNDDEKKELLLQQIEHGIMQCKEEVKKIDSEIVKIKKWIAELIHENFHVPGDFWYEELKNYTAIKAAKENKLVDEKTIKNCDNLINEYRKQIKFRETKKELNQMTIGKYEDNKQKLLQLETVEDEHGNTIVQDKFKKHKNRLNVLSEDIKNFSNEERPENQLENIVENVKLIIENHEIDEEVKTFMIKLNQQFNAELGNYDQNRLIREMESLIEEYKTGK